MNKKHKNNGNRKSGIDLDAKGCHNCANCTYIGEGDYFCDEVTPTVVITGFSVPRAATTLATGRGGKSNDGQGIDNQSDGAVRGKSLRDARRRRRMRRKARLRRVQRSHRAGRGII